MSTASTTAPTATSTATSSAAVAQVPTTAPGRRLTRAARLGTAATLAAAAGALLLAWDALTPAESRWTAIALRLVFGPGTGAAGDVVWTGIGTDRLLGMQLTMLCSTVVLLAPLCLLGAALFAGLRRSPAWRIAAGTGAALLVATLANQLRLALLVVLWRWQGQSGFDLGHRYLGSIGVIILFAVSMYLMVRIAIGGRRARARRTGGRRTGATRTRETDNTRMVDQ